MQTVQVQKGGGQTSLRSRQALTASEPDWIFVRSSSTCASRACRFRPLPTCPTHAKLLTLSLALVTRDMACAYNSWPQKNDVKFCSMPLQMICFHYFGNISKAGNGLKSTREMLAARENTLTPLIYHKPSSVCNFHAFSACKFHLLVEL